MSAARSRGGERRVLTPGCPKDGRVGATHTRVAPRTALVARRRGDRLLEARARFVDRAFRRERLGEPRSPGRSRPAPCRRSPGPPARTRWPRPAGLPPPPSACLVGAQRRKVGRLRAPGRESASGLGQMVGCRVGIVVGEAMSAASTLARPSWSVSSVARSRAIACRMCSSAVASRPSRTSRRAADQ